MEYGWSTLSIWETPPIDAYIEYKRTSTGLSEAVCRYMLIKRVDQGSGYLRCEYVKKEDVSQSILDTAGSI